MVVHILLERMPQVPRPRVCTRSRPTACVKSPPFALGAAMKGAISVLIRESCIRVYVRGKKLISAQVRKRLVWKSDLQEWQHSSFELPSSMPEEVSLLLHMLSQGRSLRHRRFSPMEERLAAKIDHIRVDNRTYRACIQEAEEGGKADHRTPEGIL